MMKRTRAGGRARRALGAVVILLAVAVADSAAAEVAESGPSAALKIGLLMDFSSGSSEVVTDRRRAFELAVKHVNAGGGVFGQPVTTAMGDTTADPEEAVAQARRLVEVEGVHAIVGPNSSANALVIAEHVIGPAGVPTISFSATSPKLTHGRRRRLPVSNRALRTWRRDRSWPPSRASRGFDNVGLLYVDDAWGQGLADAFEAAWDGALKAVAVGRGQTTFLSELRESASGGAQALVVIAFETAALTMVREALDHGLYDCFTFGDAAKRVSLVRTLGGDRLGGMYGTGPATASESAASAAWEAAYVAEYGALPVLAYVKEAYDATVALALAAAAAGSADGTAIRNHLRAIAGPPGIAVPAGPHGVSAALRTLAAGGDIDYEGASGSIDWDDNGDLRSGHLGIWRFTEDERIEEVRAVAFSPLTSSN